MTAQGRCRSTFHGRSHVCVAHRATPCPELEPRLGPDQSAGTGTDMYFCDQHASWRRDTDGLLGQYFCKGPDLFAYQRDFELLTNWFEKLAPADEAGGQRQEATVRAVACYQRAATRRDWCSRTRVCSTPQRKARFLSRIPRLLGDEGVDRRLLTHCPSISRWDRGLPSAITGQRLKPTNQHRRRCR